MTTYYFDTFRSSQTPAIHQRRPARTATTLALTAAAWLGVAWLGLSPSPARADRCDDLATQLKSQIDGLTIGKTAANVIFLQHPAATQIRLGCLSRNVTNELYAASGSRKPTPAFLNLVATASAVIFTIPKP